MTDITGPGTSVARTIPKGDLHKRLLELLEVDQLGLKIIRPGSWSPLGLASPNLVVLIHEGVDRTSEVIYSYDTGEIESAAYLWSNKKLKNAAFISGRWVQTFISTPDVGYDRRILYVEASDIDQAFTTAPAGGDLTAVVAAMQQRGIDELSAFNEVALTKAEVSKDTNKVAYREDFNVGDLITIHGDYNEISAMRVSEYVEIEDETGSSGYPTLTLLTD
jgi:hypothetical protein